MYLTIVRHALAEERDGTRWPDDIERPLSDAGAQRFRSAARGLRKLAGIPDLVLVSPLARTRATAEILSEEAGWPAATRTDALAPDGSSDAVLKELTRAGTSVGQVAIVGHEPDLSELIAVILAGADAMSFTVLKKGGAARIDLDPPFEPGCGTLRWLLTPRALRAL